MRGLTRREFFGASTAAALGGPAALAQPGSVRVRRSVYSAAAPIDDYREGVRVMKARMNTDPTSWRYQANMHGTTDAPPMGALWRQCQHGTFFFLSWHRMYLYWFERIVRKACKNDAFALPYWNYTTTTQAERRVPLAFRQTQFMGQPNALFNVRAPGLNDITNPTQLTYSSTLFATAFAYTNFPSPAGSGASFGGQVRSTPAHGAQPHGQLEMQPHDVLHGVIGGQTADMRDPNRAARDPIFWLHHANIDRLWKRWLDQGGRANPTGNTAWMKTVFRFFDENGKQVQMTGADVLNTVTQLQYRYDDDPGVLAPAAAVAGAIGLAKGKKEKLMQTVATAEKAGVALGAVPVNVAVPLKEPAKAAVKRLTAAAPADVPENALLLQVEDVTFDKPPGIYYELYLDLPAGKEEPHFQNGHYVGNLGFFAAHSAGGKDEHKMAAGVARTAATYDVSGVVRGLAERKKWDADKLTVTFVPRGLEDAKGRPIRVKTEAEIKVGKISLTGPKE